MAARIDPSAAEFCRHAGRKRVRIAENHAASRRQHLRAPPPPPPPSNLFRRFAATKTFQAEKSNWWIL